MKRKRRRDAGGGVAEAEGLGEALLVGGAGRRGDGGERARVVGADHGLVVQAVGEADARAEAAVPGIGQRARALPAFAGAGVDQRAGDVAGAGIRHGRGEVAPAILFLRRGQRGFPAQAEVEGQLLVDAPVVLDEAGEVGPLLADVADGVDAAVGGPAEQQGGEGVAAAGGEVGDRRGRRCR